jgi:hypothetical protein
VHEAAFNWVADHVLVPAWLVLGQIAVLDLGGRDINGSVRALFPNAEPYTVLDLHPGETVDIVADASSWEPDREYDVVIAAEVFEHTHVWPEICATAHKALRPGGMFIATMGGPGRQPHSGIDGEFRLLPGDYYANVAPDDLERVLQSQGWKDIVVDQAGLDVRAVAVKP